jgi:hypothetical protein
VYARAVLQHKVSHKANEPTSSRAARLDFFNSRPHQKSACLFPIDSITLMEYRAGLLTNGVGSINCRITDEIHPG